jgi:hypothetical protein
MWGGSMSLLSSILYIISGKCAKDKHREALENRVAEKLRRTIRKGLITLGASHVRFTTTCLDKLIQKCSNKINYISDGLDISEDDKAILLFHSIIALPAFIKRIQDDGMCEHMHDLYKIGPNDVSLDKDTILYPAGSWFLSYDEIYEIITESNCL